MADWDGNGYERVSALQRTLAGRTLVGLVLRGDERVLDVGCGDGYLTRAIAARLPHGSAVGIDPSPRMIDTAQARLGTTANTSFGRMSVLDLPFRAEFDLVVSFNALHWVLDQRAALARMARACRSGGRLLVQFVCDGDRPSVEDVAMAVCREPDWRAEFAGFTTPFVHVPPADVPRLAAAAGLVLIAAEVRDERWNFGSRGAFGDWCAVGFADWTASLAPERAKQWLGAVVDGYEQVLAAEGLSAGMFAFLQLRAELVPQPTGN